MVLRYRQVVDTPATVIAGEAAIVTPDDQRLHLLDDVGTEVWQLCDGAGLTLDELMTCLRSRYDGDEAVMERDTRAFLDEALACGLLIAADDGEGTAPTPG
jgi:hypothetical protein